MFGIGRLKGTVEDRFGSFKRTPEYGALRLANDLAQLVQDGIARDGITQRELAIRCGKSESYISRVIHSETKLFRVVAEILHAMGVRAKLVNVDEWNRLTAAHRDRQKINKIQSELNGREIETCQFVSGGYRIDIFRSPGEEFTPSATRPAGHMGRSSKVFIESGQDHSTGSVGQLELLSYGR